jgi:biopolymer transport protein ExbD
MPASRDQLDAASIHHRRTRRQRRDRTAVISLSMTAMIDVVFLLLIYFMVATDFRTGERMYRVELPGREGAGAPDPFRLDEEPLRIAVSSSGLSANLYQLRLDGPYRQPQTFDELHEFLHSRQVNETTVAAGSGALFRPAHPIIIQPARSTRWEHAIEAFNAAARAKYTNVTFAKPS